MIVSGMTRVRLAWQPSLFGEDRPAFDRTFAAVRRIWLDQTSWLEHAPAYVRGANRLLKEIVARRAWAQRTRRMWDRDVLEPRLTSLWRLDSGERLTPEVLEELRLALSERYGVELDAVGFNLYRDGRDSVAWHRDRIHRRIAEPVVVLLSFGAPRRLLLRPRGGGPSRAFELGHGDLFVTGGLTQRTWEHCVPKVARAEPRLSLAFRHGLDPRAYGTPGERVEHIEGIERIERIERIEPVDPTEGLP
jgi:alkylated DNA repair dioxygenase AlkB